MQILERDAIVPRPDKMKPLVGVYVVAIVFY